MFQTHHLVCATVEKIQRKHSVDGKIIILKKLKFLWVCESMSGDIMLILVT